jgi:DAK2 domain fusion protein YloV
VTAGYYNKVPDLTQAAAGWDGVQLRDALRHAAAELRLAVDEVNALNVFPVPDGDTGSNMLATIQAALDETAALSDDEATLTRVANAVSFGALMGARGNSGVILSQVFRGLTESLNGAHSLDGRRLAQGLRNGRDAACAAVAKPAEGTILTVLRDVATAATRAAERTNDIEAVLAAVVDEAAEAVARTPSQLAVLRRAGVVDAGGRGLELLLRGGLAFQRGERISAAAAAHDIALPLLDEIEADGYGYETVFVVTPKPGKRLDPARIRADLERLGQSVLVGGDARAVKLHIHNDKPDRVIAYGLRLGPLSRISVENLDRQAIGLRAARAAGAQQPQVAAAAGSEGHTMTGPAVVAVAPGAGLARVFEAAGASVVLGGQSANPSAGELAEAIRSTARGQVLVLPNNTNVALAARQAAALCPEVEVLIVGTRNSAEGVAALLALDGSAPVAEIARRMERAARQVQALQVTQAVRDARIGRHKVRRGAHIVLGGGEKLLAVAGDRTAAVLAALGRLKPGFELVTVYRGEGIDKAAAAELVAAIRAAFDSLEVELVDGDQPHYSFLISAE